MKHNKDRFLNATQAEQEFGKFCASHKSCKECGADSHGVSCRMWWMFMFYESDEQPTYSSHVKTPPPFHDSDWRVEFSDDGTTVRDPTQPRLRPRRNHGNETVRDEVPFPNSECERWLREAQLLASAAPASGIGIDWSALGSGLRKSIEQQRQREITRNEQEGNHEQEHEEGYHT